MATLASRTSTQVLLIAQATVVVGILAVLVFGVVTLRSTAHKAEEAVVLSLIYHDVVEMDDTLREWASGEDFVSSTPPDISESVRDIRLATSRLKGWGTGDRVKAAEIDGRLDAVIASADRLHGLADPAAQFEVETAPLIDSLLTVANGYWVDELAELGTSAGSASTTQRILLVLGPLLVVAGFFTMTSYSRLRARAERADAAERLARSKDDFMARVSHEIRTPLTGILGFSELLRDENMNPDDASEAIAVIADLSAEVAGLIEDLLVASAGEQGGVSLNVAEVDLRSAIEGSVTSFTDGSSVVVGTGEARALADAARVRQILRNLISNAFRYGGGRVTVVAFSDGGIAGIVVGDAGPCIIEEVVRTMFDPYTSAGGESVVPGGVGIGLAIARNLARRMGGDLTYRHTGGRSEFVLELVAARSRPSAVGEGANPGNE